MVLACELTATQSLFLKLLHVSDWVSDGRPVLAATRTGRAFVETARRRKTGGAVATVQLPCKWYRMKRAEAHATTSA